MKFKQLSDNQLAKIAGDMEFDFGKLDPSQELQTVPEWEAEQEKLNAPPDVNDLKAQLDNLANLVADLDSRSKAQDTKLTELFNQIGQAADPQREQAISQFMQNLTERINKIEMESSSNDQFVKQIKTQLDQLGMTIMPSSFAQGVGQSSSGPSWSYSPSSGQGATPQNVYNYFNPPKPPRQRKAPVKPPKSKGFFGF